MDMAVLPIPQPCCVPFPSHMRSNAELDKALGADPGTQQLTNGLPTETPREAGTSPRPRDGEWVRHACLARSLRLGLFRAVGWGSQGRFPREGEGAPSTALAWSLAKQGDSWIIFSTDIRHELNGETARWALRVSITELNCPTALSSVAQMETPSCWGCRPGSQAESAPPRAAYSPGGLPPPAPRPARCLSCQPDYQTA